MPYIYKITNNINNKIYIGKTVTSIQERWRHHKSDAYSEVHGTKYEHRPLYSAIRKYGINNFTIEEVEECSIEELEEKEKYWVEYYGSFKNGYNATKGGDGRAYLDYDLIVKTYSELKSVNKTASFLHIDRSSVSRALLATKSYTKEQIKRNANLLTANAVGQYDQNGNLIAVFPSVTEAEKAVPTGRHIGAVCKGKRKTAGGYIWKYI